MLQTFRGHKDIVRLLLKNRAEMLQDLGDVEPSVLQKISSFQYDYGGTRVHLVAGNVDATTEYLDRKTCSGCGCVAAKLSKCARCELVAYCSKECQKMHWPEHKGDCKRVLRDHKLCVIVGLKVR